jgi:hypothetical protein
MTAAYHHHVSFRLTDAEANFASDLRATFPDNTWAETFRWLLHDEVTAARIRERITGAR